MFEPENLKVILNDFIKLPPAWHPEPIAAVEVNSIIGNNCLAVKDGDCQVICIIPSNHLLANQISFSTMIALSRELVPLLCFDLLTCQVKIEAVQQIIRESEIVPYGESNPSAKTVCNKIIGVLNSETKESENPGGIKPA